MATEAADAQLFHHCFISHKANTETRGRDLALGLSIRHCKNESEEMSSQQSGRRPVQPAAKLNVCLGFPF